MATTMEIAGEAVRGTAVTTAMGAGGGTGARSAPGLGAQSGRAVRKGGLLLSSGTVRGRLRKLEFCGFIAGCSELPLLVILYW